MRRSCNCLFVLKKRASNDILPCMTTEGNATCQLMARRLSIYTQRDAREPGPEARSPGALFTLCSPYYIPIPKNLNEISKGCNVHGLAL